MTLLAFLMKACVAALRRFPDFNASLDGDSLVLKRYFHLGFAADTPNGLVVPVVRDVDRKGVLDLAREVAELAARARDGKLSPADMQGGCFSISSLGGIGGTAFTPIVNAPEVAILGVSRVGHASALGRQRVPARGSCSRSRSPTTTGSSTAPPAPASPPTWPRCWSDVRRLLL